MFPRSSNGAQVDPRLLLRVLRLTPRRLNDVVSSACPKPRSRQLPSSYQCRVLQTTTRPTASKRLPSSTVTSSLQLNWANTVFRKRDHLPLAMATAEQTRGHSHSHGHHHHHDNSYLVSSNKNDAGVRITRVGLYVNLGMAIGKGVGGYAFNSQGVSIHCS